jgi:hypothetical protein
MIPNIQIIFDNTAATDGAWFYVGKYSKWSLYIKNGVDAAVVTSVEASSDPTIQSNNVQSPAYQPTALAWKPFTVYALNALVVDYLGNVQKATVAGTSGSKPPTWNTTGTTADNTVTWTYQAAQGNSNYNSAPTSSATPAGVVICPTATTAAVLTTTGSGTVLVTGANTLYVPSDDLYVGYIRVRKASSGSLETIAYLSGEIDS